MLRLLATLGLVLATFAGTGATAFATEELYAPPSGQLEYRMPKGKTIVMEYISPTELRRSDGSTIHHDRWGNQLKWTGSKSITFSPHNGQLPQQQLQVGIKWSTRYYQQGGGDSFSRERKCQVLSRGQKTTPAGTFDNAWQVQCTNQRLDRDLPMNEEIWFSSSGRVLLTYHGWWGGSRPGSYEVNLVRLSMPTSAATIILSSR
jgi:hypothetical protein